MSSATIKVNDTVYNLIGTAEKVVTIDGDKYFEMEDKGVTSYRKMDRTSGLLVIGNAVYEKAQDPLGVKLLKGAINVASKAGDWALHGDENKSVSNARPKRKPRKTTARRKPRRDFGEDTPEFSREIKDPFENSRGVSEPRWDPGESFQNNSFNEPQWDPRW